MKTIKHCSYLLFTLALAFGMAACEGPAGAEGPRGEQGEQGSEGPAGPAGEDGNIIQSGEGAPSAAIGAIGDFYLDIETGEFYGPKDADGWGNPVIVLMGEDGENGADGEDGSQIHAGSGAPAASLGVTGDYYLDKDTYSLYGPKTESGWGAPVNLKGADGNANVTRYIFSGFDFSITSSNAHKLIFGLENADTSVWLAYLVQGDWKYVVPGYGPDGDTYYRAQFGTTSSVFDLRIRKQVGPGENFENIIVVRIVAGNTEDLTSTSISSVSPVIPRHLDVSDYQAVAEYYGFSGESNE